MTRDEKIAQACRMREDRRTLREIAEQLGVSATTALRWTDSEKAEKDRATSRTWKAANHVHVRDYYREYEDARRAECVRCGQPRGAGTGRGGVGRAGVCRACRGNARHERCLLICKWWAQGMSMPDICAELNWGSGHLRVEMDRMRAEGYDLPYRYRNGRKHLDAMAGAA